MSRSRSARLGGVALVAALLGAGLVLPGTSPAAAATAGTAAIDPAAPTFAVYPAPGGEAPIARDAGEPTIGVNWKSGKVMFQAFTETDQVTFDERTNPATATWKDVTGLSNTGVTSLDPILETDSAVGRTFITQLTPPCSNAAYTDSDGEQTATSPTGYTPFAGCGVGSNFDHQTVGTGPTINQQLDALNQGRLVYYCSQVVVESSCSVSRDGGNSFATSRPVYTFKGDLVSDQTIVGCEGLHGHLNTSPKDGTAYLPNFACNSAAALTVNRPSVNVSDDEGLTWTIRQVPDATSPNFDSDPAVDVDEDSKAYVAYENATSNMMVATTTDKGATWTPSFDLGLAVGGLKNATMPTVVAGSAGRAAVAFLGTTTEAPLNTAGQPENQIISFDPDGNDPAAGWHAYISLTYDGGATWTTTDVTPTDPVQRGCIWWGSAQNAGATANQCQDNKRNLLDFNDISVDKQGRVVFGFADGCVNRCVTEGHTRNTNVAFAARDMTRDRTLTQAQFNELYSQEDIGTIVRQQCGKGLYAAFDADPTGPLQRCSTTTVDPSTSPSVTTSPSITTSPEVTTSPVVTTSPSVTTSPEVTTSPSATTSAEVTTSPGPTTPRRPLPRRRRPHRRRPHRRQPLRRRLPRPLPRRPLPHRRRLHPRRPTRPLLRRRRRRPRQSRPPPPPPPPGRPRLRPRRLPRAAALPRRARPPRRRSRRSPAPRQQASCCRPRRSGPAPRPPCRSRGLPGPRSTSSRTRGRRRRTGWSAPSPPAPTGPPPRASVRRPTRASTRSSAAAPRGRRRC